MTAAELGVFARTFRRNSAAEIAALLGDLGFSATQLNLSAFGRPTLDSTLDEADARAIAGAFAARGVRIWGLSATYNTIHPDPIRRARETSDAAQLIAKAPWFGVEVVTLCSGTRDPSDMWRGHSDNASKSAWNDMRQSLDELTVAAADAGIRLGIEPEPGNVIQDARAAARLFREGGPDSQHWAIVLDPANLVTPAMADRQADILRDAFLRLGADTAAVHAKDVVTSGYAAAGLGLLDYKVIGRLHAELPHRVPVIAQDLREDDAARVFAFLRARFPGSQARAGAAGR